MNFLKDAYGSVATVVQLIVGFLVAVVSTVMVTGLPFWSFEPTGDGLTRQILGGLIGLGIGAAILPVLQELAYRKFG